MGTAFSSFAVPVCARTITVDVNIDKMTAVSASYLKVGAGIFQKPIITGSGNVGLTSNFEDALGGASIGRRCCKHKKS